MAGAVGGRRVARAGEGAVGIVDAGNGVTLVDMGVHVDERGPNMPARHVRRPQIGREAGARRCQRGDAIAVDHDVEERRAVRIELSAGDGGSDQRGGTRACRKQ